MRALTTPKLIDVDELRIGMFVHLDSGWMSHPFPLSNFRVATAQQIATLRAIGLRQVRWSPEQSEIQAPAAPATPPAVQESGPERATPEAPAAVQKASPAPATSAASEESAVRPAARRVNAAKAPPGEAQEHRRQLREQRMALKVCEKQFGEAAEACKQITDLVTTRPQEARGQAEALTSALAEKMLGEQDLCIRLLTESAGDRLSHHSLNVAVISLLLGRTFGFADADMLDLGVGALLHDIGKVELPVRLRHRDDTFSAAERRAYEEHVSHGVAIARRMGLSGGATLVVAQHHEYADGTGFPLKLGSDRMTLAARIVALVDRYDNLCNPYYLAQALTPHEALSLLFAHGNSKYDTSILSGFIKMMGVYPPGSTVQLTDDRYAMVTAVSSTRPLKPCVLVHDPLVPRDEALVLDLEKAGDLGIRRSIKALDLPPAAFEYLAPRQRVAYFFEPARLERPSSVPG
ncbi:MAG: HD domain-containing phosphohydrolase [Caldimonas sp.]